MDPFIEGGETSLRELDLRSLNQRFKAGKGSLLCFEFAGDGFLTHQIRKMVATLLAVWSRRFPQEHVKTIMDRKHNEKGGKVPGTASGTGLWLVSPSFTHSDAEALMEATPPIVWRKKAPVVEAEEEEGGDGAFYNY